MSSEQALKTIDFDYERDCRRPIKAWIKQIIEEDFRRYVSQREEAKFHQSGDQKHTKTL